jgi:hypothetical protein
MREPARQWVEPRDAERAPGPAPARGTPGSIARVLALQSAAGNAAVTRALQRQPGGGGGTPAPAGGMTAPGGPAPVPGASKAETDPVELLGGGARAIDITFSSTKRVLDLQLPDISDLEIGVGELETGTVPLGESGVQVNAKIGSDSPLHITASEVALQPVSGTISAEQVATAQKRTGPTTAGAIGAALGGIAGGVMGLTNPLGVAALGGPKGGAEKGGELGGAAGEWLADQFEGEHELTATITSCGIEGKLGLGYNPYIELDVSAIGTGWLFQGSPILRTFLNLDIIPSVSLKDSSVKLRFRDGKLIRTDFLLALTGRLELDFEALARFEAAVTLLPVLAEGDKKTGEDPGLFHAEWGTAIFELFEANPAIEGGIELTASKGSAMEVKGKKMKEPTRGARRAFEDNLRKNGSKLLVKGEKEGQKRRAFTDAEKSRDGKTKSSAILMYWFKPDDWYPDELWRDRNGKKDRIRRFGYRQYPEDFHAGVEGVYWPWEGKKLQFKGDDRDPRGPAVREFREDLETAGVDIDRQLAYKCDIDHVQDLAWGGRDHESNLWPLYSKANQDAGRLQSLQQKVWWVAEEGDEPRRTPIKEVPPGSWFEIRKVIDSGGIEG